MKFSEADLECPCLRSALPIVEWICKPPVYTPENLFFSLLLLIDGDTYSAGGGRWKYGPLMACDRVQRVFHRVSYCRRNLVARGSRSETCTQRECANRQSTRYERNGSSSPQFFQRNRRHPSSCDAEGGHSIATSQPSVYHHIISLHPAEGRNVGDRYHTSSSSCFNAEWIIIVSTPCDVGRAGRLPVSRRMGSFGHGSFITLVSGEVRWSCHRPGTRDTSHYTGPSFPVRFPTGCVLVLWCSRLPRTLHGEWHQTVH